MPALPNLSVAIDAIHKLEAQLILLYELHHVSVNLARSGTGSDDLRYSCSFGHPWEQGHLLYGWGSCAADAYEQARALFERECQVGTDILKREHIRAIQERHAAAAQAEIEALARS
jgi:hypothetical protein